MIDMCLYVPRNINFYSMHLSLILQVNRQLTYNKLRTNRGRTIVSDCIHVRKLSWDVQIHRFVLLIDLRLLEIFHTIATSRIESAVRIEDGGNTSSINSIVSVSSRFEICEADSFTNWWNWGSVRIESRSLARFFAQNCLH